MTIKDRVLMYFTENREKSLSELFQFLSFQSVSTDSTFQKEMNDCTEFLSKKLQSLQCDTVEIIPTEGHPLVFAEWYYSSDKPTLLLYGHYDVQPADPYDEWLSPPFAPEIRDNYIYARGASDDKGQVWCHIAAIEAYIQTVGELPVNIKIVLEGEEEIGSPHLRPFLHQFKDRLTTDLIVVSDTPMIAHQHPSICISLRGMVYLEVVLSVCNEDLHSGQHGGVIYNPLELLSQVSVALKDANGRITIPGFYDGIKNEELINSQHVQTVGFDDIAYMKDLGVSVLTGETGYNTLEKRWLRPCSDVHGIVGGYMKKGAKTVIPKSSAMKLSFRLVAGQSPDTVIQQFKQWLPSVLPSSVQYAVHVHGVGDPVSVDIHHPLIQSAKTSLRYVFDKEPVFTGEGGSIPIIADFKRILGAESLLMGFNHYNDNIHAPNERFGLANFFSGVKTMIYFLDECYNVWTG